ncbi:chromatin assembly factor 1 subunit A-domain-containing protein [Phyllosticta citrichinensis]|uniref:Chromatin assembly factor 1 subunit A-domain-containing protein n=1 Tax=Phyllosticta citrichinensis TaxID=1130410 RepID=A0ABR1XYV9_9PEZI
MADNAPLTESTPRKRPAPDDGDSHDSASSLSTPKTIESPESTRTSNAGDPRQASPSLSVAGSATDSQPATNGPPTSTANSHKAKRRKFTPFEQQQKRLEEEAKKRAKEEKKAEKEAEQEAKDRAKQEKKAQAEEKKAQAEAKKAETEAKKREKEAAKQKKEEEQAKKARAQMKIDFLFRSKPATTPPAASSSAAQEKRSPSAQQPPIHQHTSPASTQAKPTRSDYDKTFLSYSLPSHTILAPENHFYADLSDSALQTARARLDAIVSGESEEARRTIITAIEKHDFSNLFQIPEAFREKRGFLYPSVKELVAQLSGASSEVVDLTGDVSEDASRDAMEKLKAVPMKFLRFWEDIRPPYCGTFSRVQSEEQARKLALNPPSKSLPEVNYEYDSEAEWEDPGEGEDLDVEDEDDVESESGDDMEGFLVDDDDPAVQNKRRLITGDLEPVCSGLCWETNKGSLRKANGSVETFQGWSDFKMGVLLEPQPASIDPFSTAYWESDPAPLPTVQIYRDGFGTMNPPRLPLHPRPDGNMNGFPAQPTATGNAPKPPKRTVPPEVLAEFKAAIEGSDLTKLGLIEALKKQFPKIPKDAISNTLPIVAVRVGAKASEKRWALLDST